MNFGRRQRIVREMAHERELTVGELINHLAVFPRDAKVFFGGTENALTFYRTKLRGEGLVQIEFEQQVYRLHTGQLVVEDFNESSRGSRDSSG